MSIPTRPFTLALSFIATLAVSSRVALAKPADIVDTAVAAGSFKTLTAALEAAELAGALKGKGPFTVFAPTDEAFAKLPEGTIEGLLRPESRSKLAAILTYHVVAGRVPAKNVVKLRNATTLNGQRVDVAVDHGAVRIDGAKVVKADIRASNGIIHVIDRVLLPNTDDIVDTAIEAGAFKTLAAALHAADLVESLRGKGPFTVFAPSDEAFAKLPKGTVKKLLRPENKSTLAAILGYHVVEGRVTGDEVVKLRAAQSLNGQRVDIAVDRGTVRVDGSKVVKADIETSNGVIHVIDQVILPSTDDIVDTAVKAGSFKTLTAALEAASLVETLRGKGPFTVFAPTDDAFAKLPNGTVELLLKPENLDKLKAVLTYHVVPGRVFSSDLGDDSKAKTAHGDALTIRVGRGGVRVNDAKVIRADIDASNGVIHVIDSVLLPLAGETTSTRAATPTDQGRRLIELAIERGAPIFNAGDAQGCAAIYEVAANGLLALPRDVLRAPARQDLETRLTAARDEHDAIRRAWALRKALERTYIALSNPVARSASDAGACQKRQTVTHNGDTEKESMMTLYDFSNAARSGRWRSINDNVMGGVSRGGFRLMSESASLLFAGELSLENRGGFASIRTSGKSHDLSEFEGLAIRVRGDGRVYKMNVHTKHSPWGGSYRVEFPTKKGEWVTHRLPFDSFRAQFHGRLLPNAPALDRKGVRSVGITLADKREGPFQLEVDWIKAFQSAPKSTGESRPKLVDDSEPSRRTQI